MAQFSLTAVAVNNRRYVKRSRTPGLMPAFPVAQGRGVWAREQPRVVVLGHPVVGFVRRDEAKELARMETSPDAIERIAASHEADLWRALDGTLVSSWTRDGGGWVRITSAPGVRVVAGSRRRFRR